MSRNSEYFDRDQLQQYKEGTPQILKSHEPLLRETEDNSNVRALNFDELHLNEAYNSNPSNPEGPPKVNKYKRQSTNNSNSNNKPDGTQTQMQTIEAGQEQFGNMEETQIDQHESNRLNQFDQEDNVSLGDN